MSGFNDFLFDQLYKKPYIHDAYNSEDEALDHFMSGKVTVPFNDVVRLWTQYNSQLSSKLPSKFQNGDQVSLNFHDAGKVANCEVIKVHFTESKVLYDVMIALAGDTPTVDSDEEAKKLFTRLYNIDSCFVEPADGTNS